MREFCACFQQTLRTIAIIITFSYPKVNGKGNGFLTQIVENYENVSETAFKVAISAQKIHARVASIVAWLTAFLAGKGYDLLHGRPGKAKTITIIVMLILSICVGTVGTVAVVGVQSIKEAEEEMNSFELAHFKKLYPNELDYVLEMMQTNDEIHTEITKSLALGMLFGALGAYPIVLGDRRKKQKQDSVQPYEAADGAPKSTENADDTDKHLDA